MQPSPAERFHLDQQQRWLVEQQAAADQAAYVAAIQAAHHQQAEAMHVALGGSPVQYREHRINVGRASTIGTGKPHRVRLPFSCGTSLGIVLGVEAGPIDFGCLWYRLVHTFGESDQWAAINPIGQTQTSWRVLGRFELGMARFFGPFADEVAVELSPRASNVSDAPTVPAQWDGTSIFVGVSATA